MTVEVTRTAETARDFEETGPGSLATRAPWELRINTGRVAPVAALDVALQVPAALWPPVSASRAPAVFVQLWQDAGQDLLDGFDRAPGSRMDRANRVVRATLEPEAFTDRRRADGTYEAILVIATVPNGR